MNLIDLKQGRLVSAEDEKRFKEETAEAFYRDQEMKELARSYDLPRSVIEDGAVKIAQTLDDRKLCEGCKGLSSCRKPDRPGTVLKLYYDEYLGELDNRYVHCGPMRNWRRLTSNLLYSEIAPEKARSSYNGILRFAKSSSDSKSAFKSLVSEGGDILSNGEFRSSFVRGLFAVSPNSNGRVFLEYMLIRGLSLGYRTCLVSAPQLFIPLTDRVKSEARDIALEIYAKAKEAELLLIDDLGLEPKSYQIRDYYLLPLLNERRTRGRLTCACSRLTKSGLAEAYCPKDRTTSGLFLEALDYLFAQREVVEPELFESN